MSCVQLRAGRLTNATSPRNHAFHRFFLSKHVWSVIWPQYFRIRSQYFRFRKTMMFLSTRLYVFIYCKMSVFMNKRVCIFTFYKCQYLWTHICPRSHPVECQYLWTHICPCSYLVECQYFPISSIHGVFWMLLHVKYCMVHSFALLLYLIIILQSFFDLVCNCFWYQ